MQAIRTFRAVDYGLKIHGFWPADLVVVGLQFVLVHLLANSLLWDALITGPAMWLAYKGRRRPPRALEGFYLFATTPGWLMAGLRPEGYRR